MPDWYDDDCCNRNDCRPVPDEEVEEIAPNVWKHHPTGLIFKDELINDSDGNTTNRVRESKDGRFHVCYVVRGYTTTGYCIYVKRTRV